MRKKCFLVILMLVVIAVATSQAATPSTDGTPATDSADATATIPQFSAIIGLDDPNLTYTGYDTVNDLLNFSGSDAFKGVTNAPGGGVMSVATSGTLVDGFSVFVATLTVTAMVRGVTNTIVNVTIKANPALVAPGNAIATGGVITVTTTPSW